MFEIRTSASDLGTKVAMSAERGSSPRIIKRSAFGIAAVRARALCFFNEIEC
jgi:hypothetical protein